jgi:dienelactone hydrolase
MLAWLLLSVSAAAQQTISFPTRDGGLVFGDLYGKGERAVVLAHGGRFTRQGWDAQAKEDRRFDILGAVNYLRKNGARFVAVVGGSMGGDYAAEAAELEPAAIDRIVLLGAGAYTPLRAMPGRKLFILAREDNDGAGPRLPRIRTQYEQAREPRQMILLEGSAHAQFLFQTDQGERLMREILRFLSAP